LGIEKYEIKNENIYYYIKKVDENDICISLILRPLTDVIDTKPAMVEAQDYYEPSLRASSSYEILCRDETWTSDLLDESSSMKQNCIAWERGYCTKFCMDWKMINREWICEDYLVVHGVPRNFCESIKYYLGVSQEQNCENGYCITTSDYYRCQCNPDYKPDHYGMECIPKSSNQNTAIQRSNHIIDVCKNKNPCKGAVCVNLNGGIKTYFCECKRGFKRVSHQECEDIDECRTGTPCGDLMCVNTIGSYECICPNGFTHDDGLSCRDIDECTETNNCGFYGCSNFPGGYICECPVNSLWNPFSQSCEIETEDACNSNGNPCIKGKCIPIGKNNYRCECIDGYEGEKVCKHVCRNKATCGTGPKSGICVEAEDTYLCICNSEDEEFNEETKTCEPNCAAMDPIDRFIKCPGYEIDGSDGHIGSFSPAYGDQYPDIIITDDSYDSSYDLEDIDVQYT